MQRQPFVFPHIITMTTGEYTTTFNIQNPAQLISKDSNKWINKVMHVMWVGRDSSVDIVTSYGLGGPGMESRWVQDFPHLSSPAVGPTQPPI